MCGRKPENSRKDYYFRSNSKLRERDIKFSMLAKADYKISESIPVILSFRLRTFNGENFPSSKPEINYPAEQIISWKPNFENGIVFVSIML